MAKAETKHKCPVCGKYEFPSHDSYDWLKSND